MEPPQPTITTIPPPPNLTFNYAKFNTALNAGLLNPMSPPLHTTITTATRSTSPTLFEMMANDQDLHNPPLPPPPTNSLQPPPPSLTLEERQLLLQDRVAQLLSTSSPLNHHHHNHDSDTTDVKLTLTSRDGLSVTINVHRHTLIANSLFFSSKLSNHSPKLHLVHISDCDDVEVYVETLRLMYSSDLRRRLIGEDVPKVLAILKVCAAIGFQDGVLACLEHLEAAPWAEDEEEKVSELLLQLRLESYGAGEVLKRLRNGEPPQERAMENGDNSFDSEDTMMKLLNVVLEGKDERARRDMKGLVSKMLRENSRSSNELSKESLYSAFTDCLERLRVHLFEATTCHLSNVGRIARQADNIHWIVDILIDRGLGEDCLLAWSSQVDLSEMHGKISVMHRYEMSRVTARLLVGVGKGQVLVHKEVRWLLLRTWLEPFYEDFGWMRRACKGFDRHSIEEGLANTVLTLPLALQQEVFLAWFDRFLNSGEEFCPNLQKGFEVWWRRAFWRRQSGDEEERLRRLRVVETASQSNG